MYIGCTPKEKKELVRELTSIEEYVEDAIVGPSPLYPE